MTSAEFNQIFEIQLEACRSEMGLKNADYASSDTGDFLANFYDTAKRLDISPLRAWAVHFEKHIIAIEKFCKTGGLSSEPIDGRIKDGINYLFLLRALIEEMKPNDADLVEK